MIQKGDEDLHVRNAALKSGKERKPNSRFIAMRPNILTKRYCITHPDRQSDALRRPATEVRRGTYYRPYRKDLNGFASNGFLALGTFIECHLGLSSRDILYQKTVFIPFAYI